MACGVVAEKNDKSFNEILEDLQNEENVEIASEQMCNTESIYSLFIFIISLFILLLLLFVFFRHSSMNINNQVHADAVACLASVYG